MTGLSYSPTYPAPKRQVSVTFSFTDPDANFIRVWCTVAPTGSELDNKINSTNDPRNRYQVFEGAVSQAWNFTFDKGGKYTFVAQEYLKGAGYGGGYDGDPNGAANEELLGAESTLTLYVGQRVSQPIGPAGNQATLVVWVWDNTIHATTKAFHGEDSPAIQAPSPTPRVKTAMESEDVETALAALDGETVTDAIGDVSIIVSEIVEQFNDHLGDDGVSGAHIEDDTANVIRNSFTSCTSASELPKFANEALKCFGAHYTNDGGADGGGTYGPDSETYHRPGLVAVSDRENLPVYQTVSGFGEAYGALADLHRSLTAHTASASVHTVATPATLTPLAPILLVHSAFCSVLASTNPATPPAQSSGVQTLISAAGFKEG